MLRLAFLTALAISASACVLGEQFPDPPAEPPDAPDAAPPVDAFIDPTCEQPVFTTGDGHHNPGTECLSCHNGQQTPEAIGAPIFSIGGTLFADRAATIPRKGVTVIILDAEGRRLEMVSQANGNFYSNITLVPPYITFASRCPDPNVPMIENFRDGDCNSCHRAELNKDPGPIVF